jgi:hypothetical protein
VDSGVGSGTDYPSSVSRQELVERLAVVSHTTWMRQKVRDQQVPLQSLDPEPTAHDVERADDIVRELEKMSIWP